MIIAGKFVYCCNAWLDQIQWHGLCFVQDNDTSSDIMEFPAARWVCSKQALKELHCRCDHNGSIPVFHGKPQFLACLVFFWVVVVGWAFDKGTVMFQNRVFAQWSKHATENLSSLLDDTGIWDDENYTFKTMLNSVIERERE